MLAVLIYRMLTGRNDSNADQASPATCSQEKQVPQQTKRSMADPERRPLCLSAAASPVSYISENMNPGGLNPLDSLVAHSQEWQSDEITGRITGKISEYLEEARRDAVRCRQEHEMKRRDPLSVATLPSTLKRSLDDEYRRIHKDFLKRARYLETELERHSDDLRRGIVPTVLLQPGIPSLAPPSASASAASLLPPSVQAPGQPAPLDPRLRMVQQQAVTSPPSAVSPGGGLPPDDVWRVCKDAPPVLRLGGASRALPQLPVLALAFRGTLPNTLKRYLSSPVANAQPGAPLLELPLQGKMYHSGLPDSGSTSRDYERIEKWLERTNDKPFKVVFFRAQSLADAERFADEHMKRGLRFLVAKVRERPSLHLRVYPLWLSPLQRPPVGPNPDLTREVWSHPRATFMGVLEIDTTIDRPGDEPSLAFSPQYQYLAEVAAKSGP
ncbi:hypothetical protein RI367_005607 [Sorochytrium milnesiophthora]